jgi:hypothetical protein
MTEPEHPQSVATSAMASMQSLATIKIGDYELPAKILQFDAMPVWTDEQLESMRKRQEELNAVYRNINLQLESMANAWCVAFQPITDAFKQLANTLSNKPPMIDVDQLVQDLRKEHLRLYHAPQARHFLATIHTKEHFTPVARPRKCSVRRMHVYKAK